MKKVMVGIALMFPTLIFAQIQIDSSNIPQALGTQWITNSVSSETLDAGSVGGPHLWDFSEQVNRGDSSLSIIIDKKDGYFCDSFPEANLVQMGISLDSYSDTSYEYERLLKDSLETVGSIAYNPYDGIRQLYRLNPSFRIPLPINYGNQWTSFSQIKTTVTMGQQEFNVTVKDYQHWTVDGYGQVQLECGAFNNCLRVLIYDTTITSVAPIYYDTSRTIIYEFWAENYGAIVVISSNRNETNPSFTAGNFSFMTSFQKGIEENAKYKMQNEKLKAYPNPFCEKTVIHYSVNDYTITRLTIYDITGREIRKLVNNRLKPGNYTTVWNGTDKNGMKVNAGVYFYELSISTSGGTEKTRQKLIRL